MTSPGPVAFTVFGIDIMWYGVLIAAGALLGTFICYRRAPEHGITPDDILDVIIIMLPAGIVGARLYYILFEWDMYKGSISAMLDIRAGGLAIHGGLIFGFIATYFVCRHKKISFLEVLDLLFPSVALAQSIGRWGNFFNSEAHGGPTDLPWAIIVDGQKVHPTFLYESIWCLIIFIVLIRIDKERKFTGQIACLYGIMYSFERFFVESLRTDSLMIGPLKQAQVISIAIFAVSAVCYYIFSKREQTHQKEIR
jgi:phosphatidylglycerol:prolipoprotein diacylglycerol transferase